MQATRETWEVEAEDESMAEMKATAGQGESLGEKIISGELIPNSIEVEEV